MGGTDCNCCDNCIAKCKEILNDIKKSYIYDKKEFPYPEDDFGDFDE